jgi:tripartite ATP-independent transporter DctP family solute receptor
MKKHALPIISLVTAVFLLAFGSSALAGTTFPKMALKFGHSAQPTQNNAKGVVKFAELVKERTGGAVDIQVFPAAQLGSDVAVMEQVKAGLVHFTFNGPDQLSSYKEWGPAAVLNMPYVIQGNTDREQYQNLRKLVRGPLMQEVDETAGRATNLYMLDMAWWFGNLYLTTKTKRIVHPDDLNGLKIRTRDTAITRATIKALGAVPVPMSVTEVYTALQMGVVEGEDNPPMVILGYKFYEVQKYLATTAHMTVNQGVTTNYQWFQGLQPELKEIMIKSAVDAGDYMSDLQLKSLDSDMERLRQLGLVITDVNKAEFAEKTKDTWKQFEPLFGKGFYEKVKAAQ